MTHIFRPHLDDFILVYLDDILVYSKTLDDHVQHLRTTLQILRDNHVYAKLEKCDFFKQDVEFVGYIVGKGGRAHDAREISNHSRLANSTKGY
jgi:Reverse transcriptase (RNA-dependent DNA polymerase)